MDQVYFETYFSIFKGTIDISDLKVALRALGNEPKKGEIPKLLASLGDAKKRRG